MLALVLSGCGSGPRSAEAALTAIDGRLACTAPPVALDPDNDIWSCPTGDYDMRAANEESDRAASALMLASWNEDPSYVWVYGPGWAVLTYNDADAREVQRWVGGTIHHHGEYP
jgi:hypothetical protein